MSRATYWGSSSSGRHVGFGCRPTQSHS